ncbi:hypothetical protein SAMN04489724_3016 [Algoriphagus locisalis]|uniref:Double-GTPase 2 domain-containing protein n=1 Tax=Algoriphagus locisalis TaxID=305507 RepID=A0A1I7CAP9_9BACT|nr:hypothetical protein [Algoriphagus locisalis]SFT96492.1 hypothetical protein SAMN04489724_3016 [Algoriphagus locisalis]
MANCTNEECAAPDAPCHENYGELKKCPHWKAVGEKIKAIADTKATKTGKKGVVDWGGSSLTTDDLGQITIRNSPFSVGIVGKANSGKTTFLAMLFTLLQKGKKFKDYNFAGSRTLLGWDLLYHHFKVHQGNIQFPDPTPTELLRLYHLSLKDTRNHLHDLLIYEASGETFYHWSKNFDDENAKNARLIYKRANAFALFIDCDDLVHRKGLAKAEIIAIAEMLRHDLRNRPLIVVWSKADRKSEIHTNIVSSLSGELETMFPGMEEIQISNLSSSDPDDLVHKNNIYVVDWLLEKLNSPAGFQIKDLNPTQNDIFLNFRYHD